MDGLKKFLNVISKLVFIGLIITMVRCSTDNGSTANDESNKEKAATTKNNTSVDEKDNTISNNSNNLSKIKDIKKPKITLSEKEKKILDFILQEKINSFNSGRNSSLKNKLILTSSTDVELSYQENGVAADKKYKHNLLYITGQVASINSGSGQGPFLELYGYNEYSYPQLTFYEPNLDKISQINKGDYVHLVCIGAGEIIGRVIFKHCVFSEDYANNMISAEKQLIQRFLDNVQTNNSEAIEDLKSAIFYAKNLPADSTCYTDNIDCSSEILQLSDQFNNKVSLKIEGELRKKLGQTDY
ncbi:MAG: OB-fold protein [Methylophilus sp.]|uniref:OB-fold protein n=1 Tax=Methylophilus sp. TaxID=29541 RepID=UPI003FA078D3